MQFLVQEVRLANFIDELFDFLLADLELLPPVVLVEQLLIQGPVLLLPGLLLREVGRPVMVINREDDETVAGEVSAGAALRGPASCQPMQVDKGR